MYPKVIFKTSIQLRLSKAEKEDRAEAVIILSEKQ